MLILQKNVGMMIYLMIICPEDYWKWNVCGNHFFNLPVWFYSVQRLIIKVFFVQAMVSK